MLRADFLPLGLLLPTDFLFFRSLLFVERNASQAGALLVYGTTP